MLSIHLSFEEIIADWNSDNSFLEISFLASFMSCSMVANGSLKAILTFLLFTVIFKYVALTI